VYILSINIKEKYIIVRKRKELNLLGENLTQDEEIEDIVSFTDYIEPTGDIIKLFSLRDSSPTKNALESNQKDPTPPPMALPLLLMENLSISKEDTA